MYIQYWYFTCYLLQLKELKERRELKKEHAKEAAERKADNESKKKTTTEPEEKPEDKANKRIKVHTILEPKLSLWIIAVFKLVCEYLKSYMTFQNDQPLFKAWSVIQRNMVYKVRDVKKEIHKFFDVVHKTDRPLWCLDSRVL